MVYESANRMPKMQIHIPEETGSTGVQQNLPSLQPYNYSQPQVYRGGSLMTSASGGTQPPLHVQLASWAMILGGILVMFADKFIRGAAGEVAAILGATAMVLGIITIMFSSEESKTEGNSEP